MRILISGAGIAGPTLAYWLRRGGHRPTLVERAPALREGGYLVDFWGAGFEVAERMGIVPELLRRGYAVRELREVDARGRITARMDPGPAVTGTDGRFVSLARADLAATICAALPEGTEILFGRTVTGLTDHGDAVTVELSSGAREEFDLVIGADGLHSVVRELAFGPKAHYERYLGIVVAVAVLPNYPCHDELVGVTHADVGVQVLRFTQRDGSAMVAVTFRHDGAVSLDDATAQHELLRERLGDLGWEVPLLLERLPRARSFYFDRASQIRMPGWSRGRIGLVGDAAACASLLAGQGSALAMTEAYLLARALNAHPDDHRAAFATYETIRPWIRAKQNAATRSGLVFAPRNRAELRLRRTAIRAMAVPWLARLAAGRTLRDSLELPPPVDAGPDRRSGAE